MNIEKIRSQFPSLAANGGRTIYFDNAAGTQVPSRCIDRVCDYFLNSNSNTGGAFEASARSDALIDECRSAMADLIGAQDPQEVAFGSNMTTLTQAFARAFGRICSVGDEIITTRLEHEANVSPWLALEERGVCVRFADINPEDATINLESLKQQISDRTKLVCVGLASNGFGTINPVLEIANTAHEAGAYCFVDAVHYAPHGPIDVAEIGCDVLVCSAYKFFGPHIGVIWGRREVMDKIPAYHLRTVPPTIPDKFETGTQNHEGIAGALGALEYLESLAEGGNSRKERLRNALSSIKQYERSLSCALMDMFAKHSHVRVYGIKDKDRFDDRVPTFAINIQGLRSRAAAERLAEKKINVWSGNYYALEPMTRLGLEGNGGAVRISLVHYNAFEEIDRLNVELAALAK